MKLPDQAERDSFINEIDTNFSVIAPAGVGKTTAIASRIVNILCDNVNKQYKKTLIAVTYTEKAANELKSRTAKIAIEKITNSVTYNAILSEINDVFFGTIHSLAAKFIKNYGKHIGISPDFEIDENENIWKSFIEKNELVNFFTEKYDSKTINFVKILQCPPYIKQYSESTEQLNFINELLSEFAKFKKKQKTFTYSDLILIANEIASNENAIDEIHSENFSVILDEAQDTDDEQFEFLLKIARKNDEILNFSMVGDPQQAIYSSRANVEKYVKLHEDLIKSNHLIEKVFTVTMRCQHEIVEVVNKIFPSVFEKNTSGVNFVKLYEKPSSEIGHVYKILFGIDSQYDSEIQAIVDFFVSKTPSDFGINSWSKIAILAPRKAQLRDLQSCFIKNNIQVQLHADENNQNDILYIWLVSILEAIKNKSNIIEFAGVLHEIFDVKKQTIDDLITPKIENSCEEDVIISKIIQLQNSCKNLTFNETLNNVLKCFDIKNLYKNRFNMSYYDIDVKICEFFEILDQIDETAMTSDEVLSELKKKISANKNDNIIYKDAIQLLTFHKSKGLEWPVIILPFLKTPRKEMLQEEYSYDKDLSKKKWIENEQRMLYVAFTRAKQTLILMNFINETSKKLSSNMHTSLSLLSNNTFSVEKDFILTLPDFHKCDSNTSVFNENIDTYTAHTFEHILPIEDIKIENEKNTLNCIIKSLSPSTYSEDNCGFKLENFDENVEVFSEKNKKNADYGNWWHEMMSKLPWQKTDKFNDYFSNFVIDCPDPDRSKREIKLLQNNLFFRELNSNFSWQIFTEVPFQWKMSSECFFDGFIDLLAICKKTKSAIVIDWKTNSFDNEKIFFSKYFQQLAVYKQAIESILNVKVDAKIYSSFAGKFIDMTYEDN